MTSRDLALAPFFLALMTFGSFFRLESRYVESMMTRATMTIRAKAGCCVIFDGEIMVVSAVVFGGVESTHCSNTDLRMRHMIDSDLHVLQHLKRTKSSCTRSHTAYKS